MYKPNAKRYESMPYFYTGKSGLKLPKISLGFWHNFGDEKPYETVKETVLRAFDLGITHFDLANNYGRPGGSAERNLGKILNEELKPYRDELIISSKAGFGMWEGPYGSGGSRKYLMASLDQTLARLGLDYVDIFYHHVYDEHTPLEETMTTLKDIVASGKALYVGLSNYPSDKLKEAVKMLKSKGVNPVLFQPHYSLMDQFIKEEGHIKICQEDGLGIIPFSIFNQGILTDKYLNGIPDDSRAKDKDNPFLNEAAISDKLRTLLNDLKAIADREGMSLTHLSLNYVLSTEGITSALVGVSRLSQLEDLANIKDIEPLNTKTYDEMTALIKRYHQAD